MLLPEGTALAGALLPAAQHGRGQAEAAPPGWLVTTARACSLRQPTPVVPFPRRGCSGLRYCPIAEPQNLPPAHFPALPLLACEGWPEHQ